MTAYPRGGTRRIPVAGMPLHTSADPWDRVATATTRQIAGLPVD